MGLCVGGTSIKVWVRFTLVNEWQLCVSPDAVTHANSDTDAWGRGSRAFHQTCFRVTATRTFNVRVLVRVGVRVDVRVLILVLFWSG